MTARVARLGRVWPASSKSNCHHPDPRLVGQLLLRPVEKTRAARHWAGVSMLTLIHDFDVFRQIIGINLFHRC